MTDRVALITGVTGQDGAYLAELLLSKGYIVHGIKRRSSSFNSARIDHLYQDPHGPGVKFFLHYGDMTDSTNLIRIMQEVQPDRDLQSRRPKPCSRHVRDAGIYRKCRRARHAALARSDPDPCAWRRRCDSTRPRRRSCTAWCRRCRSAKRRRSIRARPTRRPSSTPTGSRSTIARPTACTPPTAFCSTTKARSAAKPLSRARSPARSPRSSAWPAEQAVSRQSRRQARLGPCARLCRGHVADRPAARTRRLRAGDGRRRIRCANSSKRPSPKSADSIEWRGKGLDEKGVDMRDRPRSG